MNGQHSFDTEVIAKKVLESEEESKPDKIHLTRAPDYGRQLRTTKARGFRLITHQEAQVRSSESEWAQQNPVDCLLTNLSIGGASFSSEARFT